MVQAREICKRMDSNLPFVTRYFCGIHKRVLSKARQEYQVTLDIYFFFVLLFVLPCRSDPGLLLVTLSLTLLPPPLPSVKRRTQKSLRRKRKAKPRWRKRTRFVCLLFIYLTIGRTDKQDNALWIAAGRGCSEAAAR